jgi:hypothetical protein
MRNDVGGAGTTTDWLCRPGKDGNRLGWSGGAPGGALGKVLALALWLLSVGTAAAEDARRILRPPPVLEEGAMACSEGTLLRSSAVERRQLGRELCYDLPIKYTLGKIYNPSKDTDDKVWLRSYGDRFVGPTIYMRPGTTAVDGKTSWVTRC